MRGRDIKKDRVDIPFIFRFAESEIVLIVVRSTLLFVGFKVIFIGFALIFVGLERALIVVRLDGWEVDRNLG